MNEMNFEVRDKNHDSRVLGSLDDLRIAIDILETNLNKLGSRLILATLNTPDESAEKSVTLLSPSSELVNLIREQSDRIAGLASQVYDLEKRLEL